MAPNHLGLRYNARGLPVTMHKKAVGDTWGRHCFLDTVGSRPQDLFTTWTEHGLSSNKMVLITSDCGIMRSPGAERP